MQDPWQDPASRPPPAGRARRLRLPAGSVPRADRCDAPAGAAATGRGDGGAMVGQQPVMRVRRSGGGRRLHRLSPVARVLPHALPRRAPPRERASRRLAEGTPLESERMIMKAVAAANLPHAD
eukprot:SAG31_NODE_1827_length_7166_cov_23.699731_2_plen_123_part_00